MIKRFFLFLFSLLYSITIFSQNSTAILYGRITDAKNQPLELVNIIVLNERTGTTTNNKGLFKLKVPANKNITVQYSILGFQTIKKKYFLKPETSTNIEIKLPETTKTLNEVSVSDIHQRNNNLVRINPKLVQTIPSPDAGIESIIKTLPGVHSNNELSSQYSVRGGNYDENLVYVNDIEVYRPFLVRSGQQEGLSFINSDMVGSILFSAGGFDAKYGDKMSSVLDIKYKKPYKFGGSFYASLMGTGAHLEGSAANSLFTYNVGMRYKTNSYMLSSLDTKGDYKPNFFDYQGFFSYEFSEKVSINLLTNISQNNYFFIPQTRETSFGTVNEALKLKIYFDGQELDRFTSGTEAVSLIIKPKSNIKLSFITSTFQSYERENYDIMGQYFLNELDKDLGSDNLGDSLMNIGVGSFLNHARNNLDANIYNFYHKGSLKTGKQLLEWGAKWQYEAISNQISEWQMMDSAGYSLPYSDTIVNLYYVLKANNEVISNRISGYFQDSYNNSFNKFNLKLIGGIRSQYWSFNNQTVVSPRGAIIVSPFWKQDIQFRFSSGYYYQMPFFKEMMMMNGEINHAIKAQRSIHFVFGTDYNISIWERPFKILTEAYYKKLDFLIPYQVDNVRIRYYGTNNSKGYVTGIDFKINGEFVPGTESWASISLMQAKEDILDDSYIDTNSTTIYPGFIPRPTDQLINFALFFQDYLPSMPSLKMHLTLFYGTGLPFGPPNKPRYQSIYRLPSYQRVDIGFSQVIKSEGKTLNKFRWLNPFKSLWISLEIFNLLGNNNTISYTWITDIHNKQYGVPNYLTSRRLNLRLIGNF
ncbi:MAG: carboxypeptidase-like regulatory domain-containing protein [Bacteroidales bacterium]|nr:carboxypeptidase-like regulatory domain-containing protein [Bacteroidales bacterium]